MTEIRKDVLDANQDQTITSLQESFRNVFALLSEIVDRGSLEQQLTAAQALGLIARGSEELLIVYQAVYPDEPQELTAPAEQQSSTQTHETALHLVHPETGSSEHEEDVAQPKDASVTKEDEPAIPLADPSEEDVAQPGTMPDALPGRVPVESDTAPAPIPADDLHEPAQAEVKHPSEASPVDEEGFTAKQRAVLDFLQNNSEREIRVAELVEDYMQHFPSTNSIAAGQAVRKAISKIMAHPDYAGRLTTNDRKTVARRYVYAETPNNENVPPASSTDESAPTDSVPQDANEHVLPPALESVNSDASVPEQNHSDQPSTTVQPEESLPPAIIADAESSTETTASVLEIFKASVDTAKLPEGFVPITQYGIGYVVGEDGKKTIYLKDTPHLLKGVALHIFEHLVAKNTGEAEFVSLKEEIEQHLGYSIATKNFMTAINDLEKRFANNEKGFFSEQRRIDGTNYRYIGVRGLLSNEQSEELQDFLAPGSEELRQA